MYFSQAIIFSLRTFSYHPEYYIVGTVENCNSSPLHYIVNVGQANQKGNGAPNLLSLKY